jgi:hypothetical protein
MSLPPGTWKANLNGTEGDLVIDAPDQQGVFTGKFFGTDIKGFWEEASQTITFSLTVFFGGGSPTIALFKGYLFRTPPNAAPGRDLATTLTGFVQLNVGGAGAATFPALGTARRNIFGWLAQITEVL